VVEAPADQVFADICAIGPAGSGQLTRPPSPDATTDTDGVRRYIAPIGAVALGRPGRVEALPFARRQIAMTSSSNATVTRRVACSWTASS
jgi:hypothetical protein